MNRKQIMAIRITVYVAVAAITAVATASVYRWWYSNRVYGPLKCDFEGDGCQVVKDLRYGTGNNDTYDIYQPPAKISSNLFILFHGGGFVYGDKSDDRRWAEFLATKGYVVAAVNYPQYADSVQWSVEASYRQVEKAVDAVVAECNRRGCNVVNIAVGGRDSGGTLAMLYAYRNESDTHEMLRFVFQQSAPADFDPEKWNMFTDLAKHEFVRHYAGLPKDDMMMAIDDYKQLMDQISPVCYIDSTAVPTLFAYGKYDTFINDDVRESLNNHLEKNGVKNTFVEYSNSGHKMLDDPEKQKEYVDEVIRYAETYFKKSK